MKKILDFIFNKQVTNRHYLYKIFGIKIKVPLIKAYKFKGIVYRDDDVASDTNIDEFKELCEMFHNNKTKHIICLNLYGYTVRRYLNDENISGPYRGYPNIGAIPNEKIVELSKDKYLGYNKELVNYINSIPDEIALHGLYHTNYERMTYKEQEKDIEKGIKLLQDLFPNKKVRFFAAPYFRYNNDTVKVCKKYNLILLGIENGYYLDEMLHDGNKNKENNMMYVFHHHMMSKENKCNELTYSLKELEQFIQININIKKENG